MSGRPFLFPGRAGYWLVCLAVIGALVGCSPKLPVSMSPEDLQTCDDNAYKDEVLSGVSQFYEEHPYLLPSGDVDLLSPLTGSVFPYGEPVVIKFDQPPATPGVLYRNYRVIVTSITGKNLERVGDQYTVVSMASLINLQVTWTPPGSGKYIINVFLRNLEPEEKLGNNTVLMGEQLELTQSGGEDFEINAGPFSAAHVCVQIDVPKAGDVQSVKPGTIMPLQNVTNQVPTITRTTTVSPTKIKTPTFTPFIPTLTSTFTFTPTFTSTFTRLPPKPKPPTDIPPTDIPPTDVPPTPVVICSSFTDERSCVANDACSWVIPPVGGPGACKDK